MILAKYPYIQAYNYRFLYNPFKTKSLATCSNSTLNITLSNIFTQPQLRHNFIPDKSRGKKYGYKYYRSKSHVRN